MSDIARQLSEICGKADSACLRGLRNPAEVKLIAVSKTFPASDIQEAIMAGQAVFGESRLQEAAPKIGALKDSLEWHFIGRVQSNKVRKILPLFEFIHAVDSLKLATYIDDVAADMQIRPRIFLQVNQSGEVTKGGFDPESLRKEIAQICSLKNLDVVGLMSIPPAVDDAQEARHWFADLREFRDELVSEGSLDLPYLSMGMSGDFEVAIEEGATHIRVGSAIFGRREKKVSGELG